jgi:hypothetical protein
VVFVHDFSCFGGAETNAVAAKKLGWLMIKKSIYIGFNHQTYGILLDIVDEY